MGCTMSGGGWCRKRAPVYASGLAAPDDGQYSIPDPYSTTEGKPPAHLKLDVSGTQAGEGTALSTAATRDRSSSRKGSSVSKDLTITPDVPAALHTVRSNESPKAPKKRPRRIPPMLGAIGRSKTERILSMRQKKKLGLRPGLLKDARGIAMGRIEGDGTWVSRNNARQAVFRQDGTIEARDGSVLGAIDANTGSVLDSARSPIGEILADGSVRERNANVGHVTADGVAFNLSGQKLGSCDAGVRGGLLDLVLLSPCPPLTCCSVPSPLCQGTSTSSRSQRNRWVVLEGVRVAAVTDGHAVVTKTATIASSRGIGASRDSGRTSRRVLFVPPAMLVAYSVGMTSHRQCVVLCVRFLLAAAVQRSFLAA